MIRRSAVVILMVNALILAGTAQTPSTPNPQQAATQRAIGEAQKQPWGCRDQVRQGPEPRMVVRISPGVTNGNAVTKVQPDTEGVVVTGHDSVYVQILIDHDGNVVCARDLDMPEVPASAELRSRSVAAAKQWKFRPYLLNGSPVFVDGVVTFAFLNP